MSVKRLFMLMASIALCIAALLIFGCDGDGLLEPPGDGNDPPPNNNGTAVALGTMRQLQDGDTWTYQVTGTYVPTGGGASAVTPADAVVSYTVPAAAAGTAQVPGANHWSVEVPLEYGGNLFMHQNVAAVSQNASGQLFIEGLSPAPGMFDVAPMVGGPLAGPDPANLTTVNTWNASGEVQTFGQLTIDTTNQGVENVAVPAGTFSSIRSTGQKSLDGYSTDFEVWVNPQLGCYVKMITTGVTAAGTLTIIHELKNTSVPLV